MISPHSPDFDQLAAIGAVRYLRADRPSHPPITGGDEPGWVRELPFPVGESTDHRVPSQTTKAAHIWVQIAPLSAADIGLTRQALWSIHPKLALSSPDPEGKLLKIGLAGTEFPAIRDWIRSVVAMPLLALHLSRPLTSVLISLERG
jgi:hypothetical protein